MATLPALTKPSLADTPIEHEAALTTLLNEFLRDYFVPGGAKTLADETGATSLQIDFLPAQLLFGQADYPHDAPTDQAANADAGAVIHGILLTNEINTQATRGGAAWQTATWVDRGFHDCLWHFIIRVPLRGDQREHPAATFRCRRLASQLLWLFSSSEKTRLSAKGITRLRVLSGPAHEPSVSFATRRMAIAHRFENRVFVA